MSSPRLHSARWTLALTGLLVALFALAALPGRADAQASTCQAPRQLGVAFVLDDSGSMDDNDPEELRAVATGIGLDRLPDSSVAAASAFAYGARRIFSATVVTPDNRQLLTDDVAGDLISFGGTDYDAALRGAFIQLGQMPASVDRKAVVLLSDGQPTEGAYDEAQKQLADAGVPIFTVGFGQADQAVLADLAATNGGDTFPVSSAGQAQDAFARIVSQLTCDAAQVTDSVDLDPGQTRDFPFDVADNDREFRALAAWDTGGVDVRLIRPDSSALQASDQRAGETFEAADTYAQAKAINPAVGGWKLRVSAAASNADRVRVAVDVYKRTGTDPPGAPDLRSPADGASIAPGAATVTWGGSRGASGYDIQVDGQVQVHADGAATSAPITWVEGRHEVRVIASNQYGSTPSQTHTISVEQATIRAPSADALLQTFKPYLFFDNKEKQQVIDVDQFLAADATVCEAVSPRYCIGTAGQRNGGSEQETLNAMGREPAGWLAFDADKRGGTPRIYGHVLASGAYRIMDYWWFLRNNPVPADSHRGDWEGMYVVTPADGSHIAFAGYAAHSGVFRYLSGAWRCGTPTGGQGQRCSRASTHLNAFVAHATHATYPQSCTHNLVGSITHGPCRQTALEQHGVTTRIVEGDFGGQKFFSGNAAPVAGFGAWAGWTGNWGDPEKGNGVTSPRSPGLQARFTSPLATTQCTHRWQGDNDHYSCNLLTARPRNAQSRADAPASEAAAAAAACEPWFAPGVAVAACDPAQVEAAIGAGTVDVPQAAGIQDPDASNGTGISQLFDEQPPKATKVTATSGVVFAHTDAADGSHDVIWQARPGGLTVQRTTSGLRAVDAAGKVVQPLTRAATSTKRAARPRVKLLKRTRTRAVLRITGAAQIAVRAQGGAESVQRVRRGRVTVPVKRSTRRVTVTAVTSEHLPSRSVTVRLPRR